MIREYLGKCLYIYIYIMYIPVNKEAKGHLLKLSGIGPKVSFWINGFVHQIKAISTYGFHEIIPLNAIIWLCWFFERIMMFKWNEGNEYFNISTYVNEWAVRKGSRNVLSDMKNHLQCMKLLLITKNYNY